MPWSPGDATKHTHKASTSKVYGRGYKNQLSDVRRYLRANSKRQGQCRIWTGSVFVSDGYGQAWIRFRGNHVWRAHRLSYRAFVGPIPKGMLVCHTCDNPLCIEPRHLWLGTHLDNMRDMWEKGRGQCFGDKDHSGERNGNAALTWEDVREIRRLKAELNLSTIVLGERFGVHNTTIARVLKGRSDG